jgi:hypothetical protein
MERREYRCTCCPRQAGCAIRLKVVGSSMPFVLAVFGDGAAGGKPVLFDRATAEASVPTDGPLLRVYVSAGLTCVLRCLSWRDEGGVVHRCQAPQPGPDRIV